MRFVRRAGRFVLPSALAVALVHACARPLPPPGGDEDREAPRVAATTPEHMAVVPGFDGAVIFRFAERVSEQGVRDDLVLISPRTGQAKVTRGREEIRVEIEGGWRDSTVYRVILLPGVRDLFGNEVRDPIELAFSTGPEIPLAVIGGLVSDRITGNPAAQALVEARLRGDSTVWIAAADSSSFFALRYLRPGLYDLTAWIDQNRNRRRDLTEPFAQGISQPINRASDTVLVDNMSVVPADTTPPTLQGAEASDSMAVRVRTDDYLEPSAPLSAIQVRLLAMPDSTLVEGEHRVMTVDSFNVMIQRRDSIAAAAAADSMAADTLRADSVRADSGVAGRVRPQPGRPATLQGRGAPPPRTAGSTDVPAPGLPLPFQDLIIIPATPLVPGERYMITLEGLRNISGRSGGSGSATFAVPERRPPPARDTTGIDTTAVRRDTIHVRSSPRHPIG
jgi:hypothetical protein